MSVTQKYRTELFSLEVRYNAGITVEFRLCWGVAYSVAYYFDALPPSFPQADAIESVFNAGGRALSRITLKGVDPDIKTFNVTGGIYDCVLQVRVGGLRDVL